MRIAEVDLGLDDMNQNSYVYLTDLLMCYIRMFMHPFHICTE